MAKEVIVGWARMVVPAAIGVSVATQNMVTVLAALFLASAWFLTWSAAEVWIDLRFGVLLGYAPISGYYKRLDFEEFVLAELDERDGAAGQRIGPRHARARVRETNAPLLPHLPHPRTRPDDSGPLEALADPAV